ncbi:MAG: Branched-chain amino acid transport system permease protein LivM [uncultured Corynebacteriales bacterium]|uniref:Branched-chain amino acid transport system permease protein LivM n=1 Tax=uncultured Mycobacteriales bacterium TaxID=581187 RepID=A0A6J4HU92_9ACTN|nr:MAG: Branched-chain amino acid transport system permease protein LivM [uncultured Corynebacteriales bacterium]
MTGTFAGQGSRFALPDVMGRVGGLWDKAPWYARYLAYALLIAFAFALPSETIGSFMTPQADWPSVLFYPIGVYVLLAIGLNVVVGQAGLLDLGFVAFFAIGAYALAIFATNNGWNFWEALPVGIIIAMAAGVILGSPTLRLRGDYLAIVTLGFGEIIRITANNLDWTGGPRGISPIPYPPSVEGFEIGDVEPLKYGVLDARPYYYLLLVFIILTIILVKRLEKSRVGRSWAAIREDEDAAELMGVPTFKFKIVAFIIGAAIGGLAGVVFGSQTTSITPVNFPFILSALILCAVVLGGSGNLVGVIVGAFLIAWLPERFREFADYRMLVFGAALVLMMIVRPEGLIPSRRRRAELAEGTGGLGALGGEAGAATAQHVHADVLTPAGGHPDGGHPDGDHADGSRPDGSRPDGTGGATVATDREADR